MEHVHPYDVRRQACIDAMPRCAPGSREYKLSRHLMRTAHRLASLAWEAR